MVALMILVGILGVFRASPWQDPGDSLGIFGKALTREVPGNPGKALGFHGADSGWS